MAEYQSFIAPEFVFGAGSRSLAGKFARKLGAVCVLLVSDAGPERAGWTGSVRQSLAEAGIGFVDFNNVSSNPRIAQVVAGTRQYIDHACDVIIAVGGGSPIDCAKAIGLLATNGGTLADYAGRDRIPRPLPPLLCVPTTASSSADVSQTAIISDPELRVKIVITSKALLPNISLVDPQTLSSFASDAAITKGLAALGNAIESYVCTSSSLLTDLHAREAIPLILGNLPAFIENPLQPAVQAGLIRGSLEAGLAFSNSGLGALHAMSTALDAYLDLPYGESSARLLPHLIKLNYPSSKTRFQEVFYLMGMHHTEKKPQVWIERFLDSYLTNIGLAPVFSSPSPDQTVLQTLADHALASPSMGRNPAVLHREDIVGLYSRIFS